MKAADYTTPMMRQYARVKEENPRTLLLIVCGHVFDAIGSDTPRLVEATT